MSFASEDDIAQYGPHGYLVNPRAVDAPKEFTESNSSRWEFSRWRQVGRKSKIVDELAASALVSSHVRINIHH